MLIPWLRARKSGSFNVSNPSTWSTGIKPTISRIYLFGSFGNKAPYMSSIRGHIKRGKKMELPVTLPKRSRCFSLGTSCSFQRDYKLKIWKSSYLVIRCSQNRNIHYVLPTVHLVIIFVNNQFDTKFFFLVHLFQFSTCFEQPCAHYQESQLYQYDIWHMSICVGDRPVCTFEWSSIQTCIPHGHPHRVTYTRCRIDTINSPDDGHIADRNM
jgi:hypothetical protein